MKINKLSDFKINEISEAVDYTTPFKFKYKTEGMNSFTAHFDGKNYTNCRRLDDGSLLVAFNNHKLPAGQLSVTREYFLTDSDFADGVCNLVSTTLLDVTLTNNESDESDITIEVYPAYQKGDDGLTPYVGANGNWWVGDQDTGSPSCGSDGTTPIIGIDTNGYWLIDYSDGAGAMQILVNGSPVQSQGNQGEKGEKGDTGEKGEKGDTGANGTNGADGADYIITDADKAEIVENIKSSFDPNPTEGSANVVASDGVYTAIEEVNKKIPTKTSQLENDSDFISQYSVLLEESLAYGIQFDTEISTPSCTRIGSSTLHKTLPVHNNMRGCLLNDDGSVNEYLPSGSWADSTRDGSQGQVMVEIPEHYRKFVTNGTVRQVWISEYPISGYTKVNKMYVSAYEAALNRTTSTLASVVNTTEDYRGGNNNADYDNTYRSFLGRPATNISLTNFRAYARNRKSGSTEWNCMTYEARKTLVWLFVTEYATLNSQAAINTELTSEGYKQGGLGNGATTVVWVDWVNLNNTTCYIPCGHTDSLGNGTGEVLYEVYDEVNDTTISTYANRYRGIELPFGHIREVADGCFIDIRQTGYDGDYAGLFRAFVTSDPANFASFSTFADSYEGYEYVGLYSGGSWSYIKEIIFGNNGEIIPETTGGASSSTYFCDITNTTSSSMLGSLEFGDFTTSMSSYAGLFHASVLYNFASGGGTVGSRLCFHPAE